MSEPAAGLAVADVLAPEVLAATELVGAVDPGPDTEVGPGPAIPTEAAGIETLPTPGRETTPEVGRVTATEPETETVAPADSAVTPTPGMETDVIAGVAVVSDALGERHWPSRQTVPKRQTLRSLPQLRLSVRRSTTLPPEAVAVADALADNNVVLDAARPATLGATHCPLRQTCG